MRISGSARCLHPSREIRWLNDAGGSRQYWHQCVDCGAKVGTAISQRVACANGEPDPIDRRRMEEGKKRADAYWAMRNERRDAAWAAWRAWYDEYLASPKWREKRAQVLERDGGRCQGCLSRSATQVHHKTYDHAGDELLFELISLCDECHERKHGVTEGGELRSKAKSASEGEQ